MTKQMDQYYFKNKQKLLVMDRVQATKVSDLSVGKVALRVLQSGDK